jgi:hypothetical protein
MGTDPASDLSTAATHQPHTDPTTRSAQTATTIPSCTSIATRLAQGDATIPEIAAVRCKPHAPSHTRVNMEALAENVDPSVPPESGC